MSGLRKKDECSYGGPLAHSADEPGVSDCGGAWERSAASLAGSKIAEERNMIDPQGDCTGWLRVTRWFLLACEHNKQPL